MTRIAVGHTRVYLSPQCEVRAAERLQLVLPVGTARVHIIIGKPILPIQTFLVSPPVPKRSKPGDKAKHPPGPREQYPPATKLGAKCYTELIAMVPLDIDESLASDFQERRPDASGQVLKLARQQETACKAALDVAAAAVGLYIHPRLVSDRISDGVVALRGGSSYATLSTAFTLHVVEAVTLRASDRTRLQKLMRTPKDLERAVRVAPWLLRAWGASDDPVDQFVSLFVPLEVNLEEEPPPRDWSEKRATVLGLLDEHGGERKDELRTFLEQVLKHPPLMSRFQQQAKRSGLKNWKKDAQAGQTFNAKRNDLLHRGDTRIPQHVKVGAGQVRTLAELVRRYVGKTIFGSLPRRHTKQQNSVLQRAVRRPMCAFRSS